MHIRLFVGALLALAFLAGALPLPRAHMHPLVAGVVWPTAQAQSRVRTLLDRLRGKTMPEGMVKTNGRLEATLVDVAAKYPGRLVDITVEEGSEVKAGQTVGRMGSTGRSTGPHLHYETRIDGEAVNPQKFLHAGAKFGLI